MNRDFGNAFARIIVECPWPQPMSATRMPASSVAWTPSSDGNPALQQVAEVAGAVEPAATMEHAVIVLVPADARARLERLGEAIDDAARGERDLEAADDERGTVFVREHHGLLGREAVLAGLRQVVARIPTRRSR